MARVFQDDTERAAPFDTAPAPLRIDRAAVARGGVTLLADMTLTVEPGAALILRGPNGAGKTTLLRSLAGLQPFLRGTATPGPDAIAYATHADGLKATLSAAENLRFWAEVYGSDSTAHTVNAALDTFDLTRLADRPAGALSAGQKRRLGLARLCVARRPIWLLDEPTVSLDAAAVARFAAAIRAHLSAGGLAVIATHIDLGLDDAAVLDLASHRTGTPLDAPDAADAFAQDDAGAFL